MARFQLDDHKLQYHPRIVADFMDGKAIVPLNAEVSITDACNHRCLFCNFNYLGHKKASLPEGRMQGMARELAEAGVKTLTFAGAGEPLLHPDVFPSLKIAHSLGMDLAMRTNGALLTQQQMEEMTDMLSWVCFSINAGTSETYAETHRCAKSEFAKVMRNLHELGAIKQRTGSKMTLGTQCVLLKENRRDIAALAKLVKNAGADYFVVKHFFPREEGEYQGDESLCNQDVLQELFDLASEMSADGFSMIIRDPAKLDRSRPYCKCLGLPFLVYIGENGLLYTCFSHHEDKTTAIGSILEHDFATLWNSHGKDLAVDHINSFYDKNTCQANCRHHQINLWLHGLKNPPAHVNFI